MFRWRSWPGLIKFLFLNAVAFVILFASYHFLVRSTFIGRVLNGRAHAFRWNPFQGSGSETPSPEQPSCLKQAT